MIPMIDAMGMPGIGTAVIAVGPGLVGVGLALAAGLAAMIRGTSEELRDQIEPDLGTRVVRVPAAHPARIAA